MAARPENCQVYCCFSKKIIMTTSELIRPIPKENLWEYRERFHQEGYLKITSLVPAELIAKITRDVHALIDRFLVRRDVTIEETGNTPRYLGNVVRDHIVDHSPFLKDLYFDNGLNDYLQQITGSSVHHCPYEPEQILISKQEKAGDTHGWHWGDYSYALIWIIEAPEMEAGGLLQCIPNTIWDKKHPNINAHLVNNLIRTYDHRSGDVYFLKTDTTLHRTTPLEREATRIMLRMAYADDTTLNKVIDHSTMEKAFE